MRIAAALLSCVVTVGACASSLTSGSLGEGSVSAARITGVDTAHPPRSAMVDLSQGGYATVVLVAPGHSATVLYPLDSTTSNQLSAGTHQLPLHVPDALVLIDSMRNPDRMPRRGQPPDSASGRSRPTRLMPLSPTTPTYLLLITSPKPLVYGRLIEKTAGVSIPTDDVEALSAVAKAVKSTIVGEPRDWAGYYRRVDLRRGG